MTIPPGARVREFAELAVGESYRLAVGYPGSESMSEAVYTKLSPRKAVGPSSVFKISPLTKVVPA